MASKRKLEQKIIHPNVATKETLTLTEGKQKPTKKDNAFTLRQLCISWIVGDEHCQADACTTIIGRDAGVQCNQCKYRYCSAHPMYNDRCVPCIINPLRNQRFQRISRRRFIQDEIETVFGSNNTVVVDTLISYCEFQAVVVLIDNIRMWFPYEGGVNLLCGLPFHVGQLSVTGHRHLIIIGPHSIQAHHMSDTYIDNLHVIKTIWSSNPPVWPLQYGVSTSDNKLFTASGQNGNHFYIYNIQRDKWTRFETLPTVGSKTLSLAVSPNGLVYCLRESAPTTFVMVFDPENEMHPIVVVPMPLTLTGKSIMVYYSRWNCLFIFTVDKICAFALDLGKACESSKNTGCNCLNAFISGHYLIFAYDNANKKQVSVCCVDLLEYRDMSDAMTGDLFTQQKQTTNYDFGCSMFVLENYM